MYSTFLFKCFTFFIAGFKSEFLLLGVNDSEGEVVILTPERFVEEGAKVY